MDITCTVAHILHLCKCFNWNDQFWPGAQRAEGGWEGRGRCAATSCLVKYDVIIQNFVKFPGGKILGFWFWSMVDQKWKSYYYEMKQWNPLARMRHQIFYTNLVVKVPHASRKKDYHCQMLFSDFSATNHLRFIVSAPNTRWWKIPLLREMIFEGACETLSSIHVMYIFFQICHYLRQCLTWRTST